MKRFHFIMITLLLFATVTLNFESYADSSPPTIECSVDNYEVPQVLITFIAIETVEVEAQKVLEISSVTFEGEITTYSCNLTFWPDINMIANFDTINIRILNKGSIENFLQEGLYTTRLEDQFVKPITKYHNQELSLLYI